MPAMLPGETLNEIVGHLHDDQTALASCSLASSVLLPWCRRHHFSEVTLHELNLASFLKLLQVSWNSITPAIRRLVLLQRHGVSTRRVRDGELNYNPGDIGTPQIISCLQGVKTIQMSVIGHEGIAQQFRMIMPFLKGVKEFDIIGSYFQSPLYLLQYIYALPGLEALSLSKVSCGKNVGYAPNPMFAEIQPKSPFRIRQLDLRQIQEPETLLGWFLAHNPIPMIDTLCIHLGRATNAATLVCDFIKRTGASVQNLRITLPSIVADYSHGPTIDISPCVNIKSLHIECLQILPEFDTLEVQKFVWTTLTQLSSPLIEEVSLTLSIPVYTPFYFLGLPDSFLLEPFGWVGLPEVLVQPTYNNLNKISISVLNCQMFERSQAEQLIRKGPLSRFNACGMLYVEFPA